MPSSLGWCGRLVGVVIVCSCRCCCSALVMLASVTLKLWFCLLSLVFCGALPVGACVKETYTRSVIGALVEVFLHSVAFCLHTARWCSQLVGLCSGHTWILITSSTLFVRMLELVIQVILLAVEVSSQHNFSWIQKCLVLFYEAM